ncbi:hypothetical protein MMYC01_201308 [Madurella mycetomatis]|uniref:Uncharacterized protein n=1 Tax=Madurella mycetomatis TaxID=100816 RepID=A0A175WFK0_9PEZI|nr:hypothetical protein MMYC01_201308 [Madurella mycetomatis]
MMSILQTDYEELLDMRFRSILYAGMKLNDREDMAEPTPAKDIHTLTDRDLDRHWEQPPPGRHHVQ